MGFDVAMDAGRRGFDESLAVGSGRLYPWMSSLLDTFGGADSTSVSFEAFARQGRKVFDFDFSGEVAAGFGAAGGGGAGLFMLGLPCLGEGLTSLGRRLGAMHVCGEDEVEEESGDLQTGRSSPGSTDPDWSTGAEMSNVLKLLLSGRPFRGRDPVLLLLELFSLTDGVRFTFEINFDRVDLSEESVESLDPSFSSMCQIWASWTTACG